MISCADQTPAPLAGGNRDGGETKLYAGKSTKLTINSQVLTAALELAESGIPVFPCLASKAPACPTGFKAASDDPETVRKLWRNHPGPLVGVATGAVSGIDVLDIDPRHEGDLWLGANKQRLPQTRTHATRSGGYHLLFRHHAGMGCSANRVAPGVDVRADGGYGLWWPEWLASLALPPAPKALPPRPVIELTGTKLQRYAMAALKNGADRVMNAREGARNSTLNAECWGLFRHFSDVIDPQRIADTMAAAALAAGLDHKETAATIASALRAEGVE